MDYIKILALGTSSNRRSINLDLARYAASLVEGADVEVLSVADYELPLFSDAREEELGTPWLAQQFVERIAAADAIVPSFAEYNGSYTAGFKNIFDWASRIDQKVFQGKPAVFLSTSPGTRGAKSVLEQALESAAYFGAEVIASLSVPSFRQNYDEKSESLKKGPLQASLVSAMEALRAEIILRRKTRQAANEEQVAAEVGTDAEAAGSLGIHTLQDKRRSCEQAV